jgi:hypothetical protein
MSLDNWIKVLGIVGVVISFLWGVWQWKDKSEQELKQRSSEAVRLAETRRLEATKPFLERQLKLYTEASQVAAQVATQGGSEAGKKARVRFWELYWGELALVENREVEAAMKQMGDAISAGAAETDLKRLSLRLAHACRASLDLSWGVRAWSRPDEAASAPEGRQ